MKTTTFMLMGWIWLLGTYPSGYAQPAHSFSFRLAGKLIIVTATANGQTGNFILDTGIQNLILNRDYYADHTYSVQSRDCLLYSAFGETIDSKTYFSKFAIGRLSLKNVYTQIISLAQLERSLGMPIQGLIGNRLLREFELLVDLQKRSLTFYPIDKAGATGHRYPVAPDDTLGFRRKGSLPCVSATVGSLKFDLLLDTGAEINLMNSRWEKRLAPYLATEQKGVTTVVGFGPSRLPKQVVLLRRLTMGAHIGPSLPVIFGSLQALNVELPGPYLDGVVGYEALGAYRFAINHRKRQIYRWLKAAQPDIRLVKREQFGN